MKRIWTAVGIGSLLVAGLAILLFKTPVSQQENLPLGKPLPDTVTVAVAMGEVSFEGSVLPPEAEMRFVDGRVFLKRSETEQWLDELKVERTEFQATPWVMGETEYISINDLCESRGLWPVFYDQGVRLYRYRLQWTEDAEAENAAQQLGMACLRLEDIMADPTDDSRFTHEKLEKLRVMARWLGDRGQEFSVAWIPIYVSPQEGIVNDLTEKFNWYNADFLYTLDVLAENGGHIGLHGLTHQYGEEASAAGYEFGEDSPFSLAEMEERICRAKAIAVKLGYQAEFFEFPHYGMTREQAEIAEKYFRVIYQQEPWAEPYGYVEMRQTEDHSVMYVPTPADYVWSEYDLEGMLSRLSESRENDRLISLFFHPSLDYERISCEEGQTPEVERLLAYDEECGILPAIVKRMEQWNLRFGVMW